MHFLYIVVLLLYYCCFVVRQKILLFLSSWSWFVWISEKAGWRLEVVSDMFHNGESDGSMDQDGMMVSDSNQPPAGISSIYSWDLPIKTP